MKLGDSFPHRINLRLSDRQFKYVNDCAFLNDCSVSDIIREFILGAMLESNKKEREKQNEYYKDNSND